MSILADTNVLLRRTQPDHHSHATAVESVSALLAADEDVYFTHQNIAEFWNVVTRPIANNGLGFTAVVAAGEVAKIEAALTRLPDVPAIYHEWKRLVILHDVKGVKVHDTRLVAAMNVHGVRRILTFNGGDFIRFEIEIVDPGAFAS